MTKEIQWVEPDSLKYFDKLGYTWYSNYDGNIVLTRNWTNITETILIDASKLLIEKCVTCRTRNRFWYRSHKDKPVFPTDMEIKAAAKVISELRKEEIKVVWVG